MYFFHLTQTNLLKAATIKGKMFSNMGKVMPKQMGIMDRKNKVKQEQQKKQFEKDKRHMLKRKNTVNMFGAGIGGASKGGSGMLENNRLDITKWSSNKKVNPKPNVTTPKTVNTNYMAAALQKKPESVLMSMVSKHHQGTACTTCSLDYFYSFVISST